MSIQDENNKNKLSKIEQIRVDLEKKLAAIEKSKSKELESAEKIIPKVENDVKVNKVEAKEEILKEIDKTNKVIEEVDSKPAFEISEPIESVEKKAIVSPVISKDKLETSVSEIKEVVKEKVNSGVKKDIAKPSHIETNVKENKISSPPKAVISSLASNDFKDNVAIEEDVEESSEKKKGALGLLPYLLLVLLLGAISYFGYNYLKDSKKLNNDLMDQKLSEFKNKRYLDSIELADLNSQLLDIQSQKMIDSLDRIYEAELIAKSSGKQRLIRLQSNNRKAQNSNTSSVVDNSIGSTIPSNSNKGTASGDNGLTVQDAIDAFSATEKELKEKSESEVVKSDAPKSEEVKSEVAKSEVAKSDNENSLKDKKADSETKKEVAVNDKKESEKEKTQTAVEKVKSTTKEKETKVAKVKKAPIYPGCEKKKSEFDRKKCLTSKMIRHVTRKFNSNIAQNIGLEEGRHKVKIHFVIDKAGYATVLSVRAENKLLEDEAIRAIQTLPKMKPGTVNGKRVKSEYNIPIRFNVEN